MVTTSVARSSSDDDALCTSGSVDDEGYGDYQFKRMPFELQGVQRLQSCRLVAGSVVARYV